MNKRRRHKAKRRRLFAVLQARLHATWLLDRRSYMATQVRLMRMGVRYEYQSY
jgi:hypothetical protein